MGEIKLIEERGLEMENLVVDLVEKLNEVIQVVNNLKCVEEDEAPIYELLGPHDALIVSKSERGLLVAGNDGWGRVQLERIKYPEEGRNMKR